MDSDLMEYKEVVSISFMNAYGHTFSLRRHVLICYNNNYVLHNNIMPWRLILYILYLVHCRIADLQKTIVLVGLLQLVLGDGPVTERTIV